MSNKLFKSVMTVFQVVVVLFLVGCVDGCALSGVQDELADGYQFGDVSRGALEDLKQVCNAENEALRNTARAAFEVATGRPFPVSICVFTDTAGFSDQAIGTLADDAIAMLCDNASEAERALARNAYELATGQKFPVPICEIYNGENIQQ